jgi:hypothetical protein
MLSSLFEMIAGFLESISIYRIFHCTDDFRRLTEKTVFQHFFSIARALFFMGYLLFFMGDSAFTASYKSLSLTVNLTLFYKVTKTLSLLGLARTILQAINFMHEKA